VGPLGEFAIPGQVDQASELVIQVCQFECPAGQGGLFPELDEQCHARAVNISQACTVYIDVSISALPYRANRIIPDRGGAWSVQVPLDIETEPVGFLG